MNRTLLFALLLTALGCAQEGTGVRSLTPEEERVDRIVARFNDGIAYMERYEPARAVEAFDEVLELSPDWSEARLNLAIALLNSQQEGDLERAEVELRKVILEMPGEPRGPFTLGMLLRYLSRTEEAKEQFAAVLRLDPEDADAHYQLGALAMNEDDAVARRHFEQTLAVLPHHQSACYRLQGLLRRAGEKEEAAELLRRFTELKESGAGLISGMKYGEMGRYAEVIRAFEQQETEGGPDGVPEYQEMAASLGLDVACGGQAGWPGPGTFGPGVAVADVDGDGDLDVYVPGALLLNADGRFSQSSGSGIDGRGAIGAFFGDYDADGLPDLYLTRAGPNRLFQNLGGGKFGDRTGKTGTAGGDELSVGASWADADHDGDLDLLVANYAGSSADGAENLLLRNNGDGRFEDVTTAYGVNSGPARTTAALFFDLDGDGDADLYLINDGSQNRLFRNDRIGRFVEVTAQYPDFADDGPGLSALFGDLDGNGYEDLLLLRGQAPPSLLLNRGRGRFEPDVAFLAQASELGGAVGGMLGDLDLDGDLDLVLTGAGGPERFGHWVLMNRGRGRFATPVLLGDLLQAPAARGAVAADLTGDGGLELLVARAGGRLEVWGAEVPAGHHWLELVPARDEGERKDVRAHPTVIGLLAEIKTGRRLQVASIRSSSGYLGSVPARVHFGLGSSQKVDYVRLSWPDAVLQSEIEVATDQRFEVSKMRRKPSSCPLLFTWDGEQFAFVTDFLGTGGVGFYVGGGEYAPPDPTEDVRIPPGMLAAKDGRLLLRVVEPLEEITWLDQLQLLAYDHPAEMEVYPDERFTGSAPFPTGEPLALAKKFLPLAARDREDRDVLKSVLAADRDSVVPPADHRFIGYAEDHWLELEFGDQLARSGAADRLVLCLYGWVEYTYSHVNFAAEQAGLSLASPCLEIPDGQGGWKVAVPELGFPAGLPRMMTFDLGHLSRHDLETLRGQGRFRIRSNMEMYVDQLFVAEECGGRDLRVHTLDPTVAELRPLGYPREFSPDGRDPTIYDYHRLDVGVPFKNMSGRYTRFGDVRELLSQVDDCFCLMARGEEIALEFDALQLPPLPEGWSRTFVLHADGYCKDMDHYTAAGETVEPTPHHRMSNYPPDSPVDAATWERQQRWNSRRISGR